MALFHVNFFSNVLGMCMQMDVILPDRVQTQTAEKDKTYPTLYLLHGMSDDHTIWQRRTSIERYASEYNLAVVMPSTHLGWYTDIAKGHKYFTFIARELPLICRDFFPKMSPLREHTFVAGLSMGGYGALKLGLLTPETFSYVASLSGALDLEAGFHYGHARGDGVGTAAFWESVFGPLDQVRGSDNDLFAAANRLLENRPQVYIWCGTEDFAYGANKAMRDHLRGLNYALTYEEAPGDHQWKYWDEMIQRVLKWLPLDKTT